MHRESIKADVGVVVGRFQVNRLHPGHVELLDWVHQQHKKVVVALGIAAVSGSRQNPLDYEARVRLILEKYQSSIVIGIRDTRDDGDWSKELDRRIEEVLAPRQSVVLYGSRDSFLAHYSGKFKTQEMMGDAEFWSGSKVREMIKNEVRPTDDFRSGVIWQALNSHCRCVPTVDIAILKEGKVLLCRKPPHLDSCRKWRFVGGFADPKSTSYEVDARREVQEETGLEVSDLRYVGNANIDDWRYRGEADRIRTTFFAANFCFGHPKAADDISEVAWHDLSELTSADLAPEHGALLQMLKEFLGGTK